MDIYPAIDLCDGHCVRLFQGDFGKKKVYSDSPLEVALSFERQGAKWLHVVDLDGAKGGEMSQKKLVLRLASESSLKVQVGGGVRTQNEVEDLLKHGVQRVVLGSLVVGKPTLVKEFLKNFGAESLTLALDVDFDAKENPLIKTQGWQKGSSLLLWDVVEEFLTSGARYFLCTDIKKDGSLQGTNEKLYRKACQLYPQLKWLASGGVASLQNVISLKKIGVSGVILGKSLYEKKLTVKEALTC